MLIQERIQLVIKANKETPSSFADKIGVQRSNLSHVLSGRNKPSFDFLSKIITHYPNVNASWLITGVTREGELEESRPNVKAQDEVRKESKQDKEIQRITILYTDGTFDVYTPNEQ